MVSILVAFGTRPEAIKVAPLIRALRNRTSAISLNVVVTAEHRQPLDQVLRLFEIDADYDLNIGALADGLIHPETRTALFHAFELWQAVAGDFDDVLLSRVEALLAGGAKAAV